MMNHQSWRPPPPPRSPLWSKNVNGKGARRSRIAAISSIRNASDSDGELGLEWTNVMADVVDATMEAVPMQMPLFVDDPSMISAAVKQRRPSMDRSNPARSIGEVQLAIDFTRALAYVDGPLVYLDMPATRGDCRGPGICPVFRCRHNLALRVKTSGAIKVDGGGPGTTLRQNSPAGPRKVERIVDAIIRKADALGSLCSLDLAEEEHWHDDPRYGKERTIPDVAEILGITEEVVRQIFLDATQELQIAEARLRRAEERAPKSAPLVQIRRRMSKMSDMHPPAPDDRR